MAGLLDSPASHEPSSSVVYVGNELANFVSTEGYDTDLLIDWLGIRPAWHRRGLGSLLLLHALEQGRANGYVTASSSANVANEASMRLMESLS
ncbi:GNAT family N-acetyltransferase [Candidatus Bipolaricaulota bacterium]